MRIVSLLPSTTETLFAIGAGADVVGVTHECDYPAAARACRVVTGSTLSPGLSPGQVDAAVRERVGAGQELYYLDEAALRDLDPELVLTQDLCAVCAVDVDSVDAALTHLGCHADVLTVDPGTLDEVLTAILTVGERAGRSDAAQQVVAGLRSRLKSVADAVADRARPRVAVLEWTDPPFTAGHWVPDMVSAAGGTPTMGASGERSRTTSWDEVARGEPDLVVVSPCGYDLAGATTAAVQVRRSGVFPEQVPIWAVDADAVVVRPGPRLVDGVEMLASLCHPGRVPARTDLATRV